MELESLRYIWHALEAPPDVAKDRQSLLALLQKKSQAPVARMRRNLIGEGILLLAAYTPAILCFLFGFEGRFAAISWLFLLVLVFFFAYYFLKYRLLRKMQCPTCQLRSNLVRQVETLQKYIRFYLLAGTAMIPLTYALSWLVVRWKFDIPIGWLVLLVPVTIVMYFINAAYINRLYGRHIKKLQELLRELDSE
jgi:hypothetical protein